MPIFNLRSHPDRLPSRASWVTVDLSSNSDGFSLAYHAASADRLVWPAVTPAARADQLWRTTCFELFLQFDDGERYVEFNFSPSTQWAAYAFDGYRDGMALLDLAFAPVVERLPDGVAVTLDLGMLPRGEHRMGLSAVIDELDGAKSYWALAHAAGPPDFHNPACFIATLPAPDAS